MKKKRVYHLKGGEIVTDDDFDRMSDEVAVRDFDLAEFRRLPGRPLMGEAVAEVVPVRIEPALIETIDIRAKTEGTTRSDIIRRAIHNYLAS
ncbi:MAG: CopG family transcriptional regulator [Acidimicrobiaceae bacterium]|nr:CopG family transcriptional regulator [Acidimicrobiaceae bacterium]